MAHVSKGIRGSIGKELVFREWGGKLIVSKRPRARPEKPKPAQAATQEKFRMASKYAKAIKDNADQSLAQAYDAARRPRQTMYSRALEDFMVSPVVQNINTQSYKGAVADKLVIRAVDDFRVKEVRVEIYTANGSLLETGNAVQNRNGIDWTYTTTQANNELAGTRIKVVAIDVPDNEGVLEVTI